MIRNLYKMAFITSPIIALYGVCPFYIFKIIGFSDAMILAFGLTLNTLLAWIILIQLKSRFPSINNFWLFVLSYGVNMIIRLVLILFTSPFDWAKPPIEDKYLAYPIVTSFALNAIIIVIINSIVNTYKYSQSKQELHEIKLQHSEAQKLVLLQQMHPHFLFNALSNLKSLIKDNADAAENYTVKLSEFLRYAVQSHQSELVTVEKELNFTMDYIELQKVRFGNAFTYKIDIPHDVLGYQIPVLALQTLVENIFKHNYFTDRRPLHFTIVYLDNSLIVWNKKSSVKLTERTSIGLANLQKRYELIFQKSIIVKNTEDDFTVTIPLCPV